MVVSDIWEDDKIFWGGVCKGEIWKCFINFISKVCDEIYLYLYKIFF